MSSGTGREVDREGLEGLLDLPPISPVLTAMNHAEVADAESLSPRLSLPNSKSLEELACMDPSSRPMKPVSLIPSPRGSHTGHGGGASLRRTTSDRLVPSVGTARSRGPSPANSRSTSVDRKKHGLGSLVRPIPRNKDLFVPIQDSTYHIAEEGPDDIQGSPTETDDDVELPDLLGADDLVLSTVAKRGRITVICVADSFERKALETGLRKLYPEAMYKAYPEGVYLQTPYAARGTRGDVFIFDYGVVGCWNLTPKQEENLLKQLDEFCNDKLEDQGEEAHSENFSFHYSKQQQPHIQNETITIQTKQSEDHTVKMAITQALAQSSKLSVYENRIMGLVEEVRYLPEELAENGEIQMDRKEMAMLMGKVLIQKSAVNLLSPVLDTPEFFWLMPDNLQLMYSSVMEYLLLRDRVELINSKFVVIQKMLKIWSNQSHNAYLSRLEMVVVWLVLIEVALAAVEVVGFFYYHWVPQTRSPPPGGGSPHLPGW